MTRVLLINPSYYGSYGNAKAGLINPVHPTLGLATIGAAALARGHTVEIMDLSSKPYDHHKIRERILAFKPDIVGATATTPLMNQVRDISVLVKNISPNIRMVAGGAHPSALPVETIKESLVDAVFVGEADFSFADYCDASDPATVKGIYYRTNGEPVFTGYRPLIHNLDDLPMPAWHLYNPDDYHEMSRLYARRTPIAMIEFSRGCVFKCNFCASKVTLGLGYRKKSPQRCAEEVRHLWSLGFREAKLADDIFTSDQKWAAEVSEAIASLNIDIIWTASNGIRVESADETLFAKMRRAGCYRVSFGFESGNDEVLRMFGKGGRASIEQGRKAVRLAKDAGLDTTGFFMLGLTPDTEQTMMETIEFARQLPLDLLKFGVTVAFPGTPMFNEAVREGRVKTFNWDDYFIYSEEPLFVHPSISYGAIVKYMKYAYRRAVLYNPRFWLQRFVRGIKTGDIFWDIYYFLKFTLLSATSKTYAAKYFAREKWPNYDFAANRPTTGFYQQAGSDKVYKVA